MGAEERWMMAGLDREVTIDFEPLGRRTRVALGTTLLEAAQQAGVGLSAVCGGGGTCGACRVRIMAGSVSPPVESEKRARAEGLRLACQTRVQGDVRVDVPPASMTAPQRAQVEGHEPVVELDTAVEIVDVVLEEASLSDLRADSTRLCQAFQAQRQTRVESIDGLVLREIPLALREGDWSLRSIVRQGEVVALIGGDRSALGLAVDVGTTKLAGYLIDLTSGVTLSAAGVMNPQIAYGEDVMARITYAMQGVEHAIGLHNVIVAGLNDLAGTLCQDAGSEPREIVDAVLVGNTCMHHLAMGLPVNQLGRSPFVAVLGESYDIKARDLGLRIAPGAYAHLLPNIAGFVGADHVSMVLATGLHQTDKVTIGLDIGTNTEISLAVGGRLLSCSCASGPAFEGAHIRDGMRAAPGAIERIRGIDGRIVYQTIDDAPPVGICGSGILDGVAELRRIGVVRPNGAMKADSHARVRQGDSGREFLLVPAGERDAPRDIVISRKDVNEIQLAKAAIRGGIEVLLSEAGLEAGQLERVIVAGAFGTYLDVDSALAVGMFPSLPRECFKQVGNAAGIGAKLSLMSRRCRSTAQEIAQRMEYVELTTHPRFVEIYAEALMLP